MPFLIVRNDITKMQVDAIVNPASSLPGYGAGIDKAVYEAAGADALYKRRAEIGRIECGASAVTEGFALPARHIIHTVGCPWRDGLSGEEDIIRRCYKSSLAEAASLGIETVAVPLLASGSFGFPKGVAMDIALSEIKEFLNDHDLTIYLVVFDDESYALSSEIFADIDAYIDSNYVDMATEAEYFYEAPSFISSGEDADADFEPARPKPVVPGAAATEPRRVGLFKNNRKLFGGKRKGKEISEGASFDTTQPIPDAMQSAQAMKPTKPVQAMQPTAFMGAAMDSFAVKPGKSLDDVVRNLDKTFMELVFTYADEKGITDVELQKKANINRKAFSKLKCGTTKNPSKATALCFAIALELSLDETKDLLARAGLALSPCSRQDIIVQYFIEHSAYDMFAVNEALFAHGEPTIGDVEA